MSNPREGMINLKRKRTKVRTRQQVALAEKKLCQLRMTPRESEQIRTESNSSCEEMAATSFVSYHRRTKRTLGQAKSAAATVHSCKPMLFSLLFGAILAGSWQIATGRLLNPRAPAAPNSRTTATSIMSTRDASSDLSAVMMVDSANNYHQNHQAFDCNSTPARSRRSAPELSGGADGTRKMAARFSAARSGSLGAAAESHLSGAGGGAELQLLGATSRAAGSSIKNVTAQNGQSVLLHCIVEPSGDIAVSWFRGRGEPQLLTYESTTVVDDERFVVRRGLLKDDDWALQIKNLDKNTDAGLYQCQTNSEPPESQFYQLNILEPQVTILGAPDMAVKLGAMINLTCVISQSPDQLPYIFWYRNERLINYDMNERGKIVNSKWPHKLDTISSNLQIFHSRLTDSGNYTCQPGGARNMTITVHVLEGFDKRLIMFQNDNYEPSAASSQQTNSALSVHVVRLSRGRVYALFWTFIIFSTWYQLVTQVQTAISLVLLAIIGLFLGHATDAPSDEDRMLMRGRYDQKDVAESRRRRRLDETGNDSISSNNADTSTSTDPSMDPLIRQAHSALNLLKNLASDDDDDSIGSHSTRSRRQQRQQQHQHHGRQTTDTANDNNINTVPLTSPSASSNSGSSASSSSASTGYNSDTRSSNLMVVSRATTDAATATTDLDADLSSLDTLKVIRLRRKVSMQPNQDEKATGGGDNDDEMIELVSEPTAMRLIMDELASCNSKLASRLSVQTVAVGGCSSSVSVSNNSTKIPLKPPRQQFVSGGYGGDPPEADDEPHYSSPTLMLYRHRGDEPFGSLSSSSIIVPSSSTSPTGGSVSESPAGATCDRV